MRFMGFSDEVAHSPDFEKESGGQTGLETES